MPPKKTSAPSKKTEEKKKAKVVEDKTFGLKNKKGAKQQKFIQIVNKNVKSGGDPIQKKIEEQRKKDKEKKEQEQKEKAMVNDLFKPVIDKVDKSVDPKFVLCPMFKQSVCSKGLKCKFSHDMNIGRKVEKRNIYVDSRDVDTDDQEGDKSRTDIICKYFLDAVENSKYGWFWVCPSGDKCIYRHAIPEGYILKKDMKKTDKKDEISIEELVEKERAALGSNLTKITYVTFLAWKKRKLAERKKEDVKKQAKKKSDYKSGRNAGLSGKDMFIYNPDMGDGELEEGDEDMDLAELKDEDEEEDKDVVYKTWTLEDIENEQIDEAEAVKAKEEAGKPVEAGAVGGADAVPIDENLFDTDDLELDGLDEDLDGLNVSQ